MKSFDYRKTVRRTGSTKSRYVNNGGNIRSIEENHFVQISDRINKRAKTMNSSRKQLIIITIAAMTMIPISQAVAIPTIDSKSPLCDNVCHCDNILEKGYLKADCTNTYLSIVFPVNDWPSNVTHMDLSSNKITSLDVEMSHDTIQVLDLGHNQISSMVQNAFGGLSKLTYLNLAGNRITNLEDNGFYGLDHLKSLNLSGNGLKTLPDNIFYNFVGLQELSLADNPLVHIDPLHLNKMISLRWLDLSAIGAYSLPANMFHTTGQLEFLDLSTNEFYDVPTDALRSAIALKHLRFSENPLDFLHKKSLMKLKLLEILEMDNMDSLKSIESNTFSDLESLHSLRMRYNRYLSSIDKNAFSGLFNNTRPVLQEVDLEGNSLQTLEEDTVACSRIKVFNVQRNPWICDCNLKWIKECHIQQVYSADLKCNSPEEAASALILNMSEEDFICEAGPEKAILAAEAHHEHVVRTVSIGMVSGFLVIIAVGLAIIFKWKDIKSWYSFNKRGPGAVYYVRARNSPREI